MRIDLSLARQILFSIEEEKLNNRSLNEEDFILQYNFKDEKYYTTSKSNRDIFIYHLKYLHEKCIIKCDLVQIGDFQYNARGGVVDLTVEGHDILDKIRGDKIFNKILEKLQSLGIGTGIDILKTVSLKVIGEIIG